MRGSHLIGVKAAKCGALKASVRRSGWQRRASGVTLASVVANKPEVCSAQQSLPAMIHLELPCDRSAAVGKMSIRDKESVEHSGL